MSSYLKELDGVIQNAPTLFHLPSVALTIRTPSRPKIRLSSGGHFTDTSQLYKAKSTLIALTSLGMLLLWPTQSTAYLAISSLCFDPEKTLRYA